MKILHSGLEGERSKGPTEVRHWDLLSSAKEVSETHWSLTSSGDHSHPPERQPQVSDMETEIRNLTYKKLSHGVDKSLLIAVFGEFIFLIKLSRHFCLRHLEVILSKGLIIFCILLHRLLE